MSSEYSNAVAYFHWPPVWFGEQPEHIDSSDDLSRMVYHTQLQNNIDVIVQQKGVVIFTFLKTSDGHIDPSTAMPPSNEEKKSIENAIYWRIQVMNAHLICLYSAIGMRHHGRHLRKMTITPSSLLRYADNAFISAHNNSAIAEMHFVECANAIPSNFLWWREKRELTIERDTLDLSFQILTNILQHKKKDALQLVQLFARSCYAYEDHEFDLSLITAWAVIERLIQVFWNGYIEANRERPTGEIFINGKRKKRLLDHRQYTIASIVEILSLTNTIPLSLYNEINIIRDARNKWIHDLKSISQDQSSNAILLASELLRLIYGIELRVSLRVDMML
jgi:hypothetical protein